MAVDAVWDSSVALERTSERRKAVGGWEGLWRFSAPGSGLCEDGVKITIFSGRGQVAADGLGGRVEYTGFGPHREARSHRPASSSCVC